MFGTRSDDGERAVERLLTIVRTCQLQRLNALAYLTAAIAAHRPQSSDRIIAETGSDSLNCYVLRR
jgi:hypothetical protein